MQNKPSMSRSQVARVLRAIRALERRCLSSDSKPTTAKDIQEKTTADLISYYRWLREQAPITALGYPYDFAELAGKDEKILTV